MFFVYFSWAMQSKGFERATGDWWPVAAPYLIGSWSSLFSLLWTIFIPLFLARGHPERLQINDTCLSMLQSGSVSVCLFTFRMYARQPRFVVFFFIPSVWGVVASDMSRTVAPWCRAPGAENTKRAQGLQQRWREHPEDDVCFTRDIWQS